MKAIWAQSLDGIIGDGSGMPWHLPEDLAHFKKSTMGEDILMGRKTWGSIGSRALPGRDNLVLSSREPGEWSHGARVIHEVPEAFSGWLIGGGSLYNKLLPQLDEVLVTYVRTRLTGVYTSPVTVPDLASLPQFTVTAETPWQRSTKGTVTHSGQPATYRFVRYTRTATDD